MTNISNVHNIGDRPTAIQITRFAHFCEKPWSGLSAFCFHCYERQSTTAHIATIDRFRGELRSKNLSKYKCKCSTQPSTMEAEVIAAEDTT
ncbi:hypothetical protein [Scytonema sp. PCC 10023]|uniref:hypothetical protein n=1 Tax=Scytonema sp. PCC 10023 TaxID=1680591 RepID=UPI0039C5B1F2